MRIIVLGFFLVNFAEKTYYIVSFGNWDVKLEFIRIRELTTAPL